MNREQIIKKLELLSTLIENSIVRISARGVPHIVVNSYYSICYFRKYDSYRIWSGYATPENKVLCSFMTFKAVVDFFTKINSRKENKMKEEKLNYDKKKLFETLRLIPTFCVGDEYFYLTGSEIKSGLFLGFDFTCYGEIPRASEGKVYLAIKFDIQLQTGGSTNKFPVERLFKTKEDAAESFLKANSIGHDVIKVNHPESNNKKVKDLINLLITLDPEADITNRYEYMLNSLGSLVYKDKTTPKCTTTSEYWDCECAQDYIHSTSEERCPVCKAERTNSSDSIIEEVEKGDNLYDKRPIRRIPE